MQARSLYRNRKIMNHDKPPNGPGTKPLWAESRNLSIRLRYYLPRPVKCWLLFVV